jgi:hypothetical protein
MCGKVYVCANKEAKDENIMKVIFLLENMEVLGKLDT